MYKRQPVHKLCLLPARDEILQDYDYLAQCYFIQPLAYYYYDHLVNTIVMNHHNIFLVNFASLHASNYHSFGGILMFVLYVNLCGILCLTHFHLMLWGIFHVFGGLIL